MLLAWAHAAGAHVEQASSSTWCYGDPDSRAAWGGMWAERVVSSSIADQLVGSGAATRVDLDDIADGWRAWAQEPDGWISILHGELLIRAERGALTGPAPSAKVTSDQRT